MSTKRLLFFSCEPGGAEVLIPVIELLRENRNYETVVLGYSHALERFSKKDVSFIEINSIEKNDFELINRFSPHFIFSSAASMPSKDMSEKFLWQNAKRMGIPTLAFLDQWQNYALRFSGDSQEERLKYLPDYINCINSIAKNEMIREGFSSDILVTLGHPYLTGLGSEYNSINRDDIRKELSISDGQEVILFVSEAIYEHYGNRRGYNQYEVIEGFLRNMAEEYADAAILLKLHPKDEIQNYIYLQRQYEELDFRILANEFSPVTCLRASDRVYGMTSLMLIEAYILGKQVVSLQPNLRVEDPLILSRCGLIHRISSFNEFKFDHSQDTEKIDFDYVFLAEKLMAFLDHILN